MENFLIDFEVNYIMSMRESKVEGIGIGVLQVAKEMAKYKVPDEDIIKVTCLSKKELQDLKKQELGYKGI